MSDDNISLKNIENKIYLIRGRKVILDSDLAILYGVETKSLKRQVRRNSIRFPGDFMFEVSNQELEDWRSQIGTSNPGMKMGLRVKPFAFTEYGVAMLSSVLNSDKAILVNIEIMRAFINHRQIQVSSPEILLKINELESKLTTHDNKIHSIIETIRLLLNSNPTSSRKIGFNRNNE